jgi:hypothetical protein
MAYAKPELVLNGAAQNLVLCDSGLLGCFAENVNPPDNSLLPELW